jgi:hypothetical protein
VDDEREVLSAVSAVLEDRLDLQIFTAQTAEDAIRLLPAVDGVIADCIFPKVEDFEAQVRRTGKPIIRMSGRVDRATNLELIKPFTSRQIEESLELLRFFQSGICRTRLR